MQDRFRAIGEDLHKRLQDESDNCVSAIIAEIFLPLLVKALRAYFYYLPDPHVVDTIAEDTLMRYLENPGKFDPSKRSLIGYLYMDAYWDIKNLMERPKKVVELSSPFTEYEVNSGTVQTDPEKILLEKEFQHLDEDSLIVRIVKSVIVDPVDRDVLELMMEGVRETHQYAVVLNLHELSPENQATAVKRHKDRLKKALQRALKRKVKDKGHGE